MLLLALLIAVGGAVGAVARFLVTETLQRRLGDRYPWGTLGVNISGSLALGIVLGSVDATPVAAAIQSFVAVGFLGDFTTYSTFSMENVSMLRRRRARRAATYAAISVVACVAAILGGIALGELLQR